MFFERSINRTMNNTDNISRIKESVDQADAVIIGAGAGLSTAAGYSYSGERFNRYFSDFKEKYGIQDMYSGGFYPFDDLEGYWGWWARHIYVNRYDRPRNDVYDNLFKLVKDKDYFVLTTNVDHQFQLAGFDKKRLFYTQGDYGLWQCSEPCHKATYDNEKQVKDMLVSTNFLVEKDGKYEVDFDNKANWKMEIPTDLIPRCTHCGKPMVMNLRADDTFVEDEGWYAANNRFAEFLSKHGVSGSFGFVDVAKSKKESDEKIVYLELGVGGNTPGIIKYPFWRAVFDNPSATYISLNYGEAYAPDEILDRSICVDGDIAELLKELKE